MGLEQLPRSGVLGRMAPEMVTALAGYASEIPVQPGQVVIRQGQEQFDLFFVVQGQMEVLAEVNNKEVLLAKIDPGECFGEISIFQPGLASATVRAAGAVLLWKMDGDNLQAFLESYPRDASVLLLSICEVLAQRLRHSVQLIKQIKVMPSFFSVRSRLRQQPSGSAS
jgi:CRP-like cAMP-binding protein